MTLQHSWKIRSVSIAPHSMPDTCNRGHQKTFTSFSPPTLSLDLPQSSESLEMPWALKIKMKELQEQQTPAFPLAGLSPVQLATSGPESPNWWNRLLLLHAEDGTPPLLCTIMHIWKPPSDPWKETKSREKGTIRNPSHPNHQGQVGRIGQRRMGMNPHQVHSGKVAWDQVE